MAISKNNFEKINDENMKIELLRNLGLMGKKVKEVPQFYYNGAYTDKTVKCSVVGYIDDNEIIIEFNGLNHSIHPDCLKQMQKDIKPEEVEISEDFQMSFAI